MLNKLLWTAIITPFEELGNNIDFKSLELFLRFQEAADNGVILFGSTGEGLSLSYEEKKKILKFAINLKLKIPLMVGVPSYNLNIALEWIKYCNEFPLTGYLITTPIYTKPGIIGQTKWLEQLLINSKHDCMFYNIPSRAGIKLHPEAVKNLSANEKFVAIKDSSGTIESLIEYKTAAPNIAIYCGDDYMMPAMAAESAHGLISVASNVWPTATNRYVKMCLNGVNLDIGLWSKACESLFAASNPIPVKKLLYQLGLISSPFVRLPLCTDDLESISELIAAHESIINWENKYVS